MASAASNSSTATATSRGTCACRADGLPRACYECLNAKLANGETCIVTPLGLCMSTYTADNLQPFFESTFALCSSSSSCSVVAHSSENFWSSNTTYCEASDASCTKCSTSWVDAYQRDQLRDTTAFSCTGAGGCVCTAYCALRSANITLPTAFDTGGLTCYLSSGSSGTAAASAARMNTIMNSVALVGAAIMLAFAIRSGVTNFRQRDHEHNLQARRRVERIEREAARRSRLTLNLDGWNSYREQLIGSEQESLGLKDEPQLSHEPMCVIVEEGGGYRPESPSRMAATQHTAAAS